MAADQEGVTRRLTAILSADVVGYSRLMGKDEEGTLAQLKRHRRELLDPNIAEHHGRIVKTTGDGVLVEFPSVVDAVRCAADVQRGMAERNAGVAEDRRMEFRVGINLGDVIIDGDDIHGDGVNVAARLQELAEPGGICLSGVVHDQVTGKVPAAFEDAGEHQVKNIARPIHVWRWASDGGGRLEDTRQAEPLPLPDRPSIAVLPFENMSGDPQQEYFVDGITEDIITALSRIRWFFVIARNSTFAYKGQSSDVRRVAADLGVRYVLEGSVRKAGNRIRLTAQLIDGASGNHIWAERYDRELQDVFELQDELTETIAGRIEPALSQVERERAKAKKPENLDAWEIYQQGMWHLHRRTRDHLVEAQALFDRAIELDPRLVSAYSGSAEVCFFRIVGGFADSPDACREEGLRWAQTAVELDKQDAGARYALGRIYTVRREHDLAIAQLTTALELNPSYAWAHYALGMAMGTSGRPTEAIEPIRMAMRLSPHDPYLGQFMVHMGAAYLFMGQQEEALSWAKRSLREPNNQWSRYALLLSALGHLGRTDDVQPALEALLRLKPEINIHFVGEWWPISDPASREHLLDGLRKAGLTE